MITIFLIYQDKCPTEFSNCHVCEQMILTTYGRSSGFCIDPIEKNHLIIFTPAAACCRLVQLAAIWCANFARIGTSANRKTWIA